MRSIYAATASFISKTFESREKMAAICILAMFTSDVTLSCIACHR